MSGGWEIGIRKLPVVRLRHKEHPYHDAYVVLGEIGNKKRYLAMNLRTKVIFQIYAEQYEIVPDEDL